VHAGFGKRPGKTEQPQRLSPRPGPTFTDRPTQEIVDFIDTHREEFGVEPIITVLRTAGVTVAPSTYYDTKTRPPSARAQRDAELGPALRQLWEDNYRVYGVRKLWKTARRVGHDVGRD
jgi:putative transposase